MPRTFGRNQVHVSQVAGWTEVDRPLVEVAAAGADRTSTERIAALVAERIPDGATIQAGHRLDPERAARAACATTATSACTPSCSPTALIDLVEPGVVTGTRKRLAPGKVVTTFALGTQAALRLPAREPGGRVPAGRLRERPARDRQEDCFVSINATTEVDLVGQCASETVAGRYWSSSGGQADFARGAMYSPHGQGVHRAAFDRAAGREVSRIRATLTPGSMVTTLQEHRRPRRHRVRRRRHAGPVDLPARRALIGIAHPRFRDELTADARRLGYL